METVTRIANVGIGNPVDRGDPLRIGRYELIARLGTGGMAEAHLALAGELPGLRTLVVVKRILPHLSSNQSFVRMFYDEARIGALLDHPNIARIIEVGCDSGGYFLVMEAVQGKSLSTFLRHAVGEGSRVSHEMAAFIVAQAANGLGYAHALTYGGRPMNLVHRDVSPENLLVSFEGAIKVIDFGIASSLGRLTETRPGGRKGKVDYMSPEQVMGGNVDQRSDIFALGIVLWEAVCGRRLFRRSTELATVRAIVDEPVPRPSETIEISPQLEHIIMRALERDPSRRFQDAQELSLLLLRHALASARFSPNQLGERMRKVFARDHAAWRATVGTAVDIEGRRPRKLTPRFGRESPSRDETGGPTRRLYVVRQPRAEAVPPVAAAVMDDARPRRRSGGSTNIVWMALICCLGLPQAVPTRSDVRVATVHEREPSPPSAATSGCRALDPPVCTAITSSQPAAPAELSRAETRPPRKAAHRSPKRPRRDAARALAQATSSRSPAPVTTHVWRDPFE
jgi:serine/threonine protein kinase